MYERNLKEHQQSAISFDHLAYLEPRRLERSPEESKRFRRALPDPTKEPTKRGMESEMRHYEEI